MISSRTQKLIFGYAGISGLLGIKRGLEDYKYRNNLYKTNFFYSKYFLYGFSGILFYVCPLTHLVMIPKEIYRLEVNIRNLEDEKKTEYYNVLF